MSYQSDTLCRLMAQRGAEADIHSPEPEIKVRGIDMPWLNQAGLPSTRLRITRSARQGAGSGSSYFLCHPDPEDTVSRLMLRGAGLR